MAKYGEATTGLAPAFQPGDREAMYDYVNRYVFGHQMLDQMQLFASNLAGGNTQGALKSISDPASMSPEERRKLSDRLGLTGSWLAPVVDITTHPLALLGIIATMVTRLPTAEGLSVWRAGYENAKRTVIPLLNKLSPISWILRDTKIPPMLDEVGARIMAIRSEAVTSLYDVFEKLPGKKEWTTDEARRIFAKLGGLDRAGWNVTKNADPAWSVLRDSIGRWNEKGWAGSALGYDEATARELVGLLHEGPLPDIVLTEREQILHDGIRGTLDNIYKRLTDIGRGGSEEAKRWLVAATGVFQGRPFRMPTDAEVESFFKYNPFYAPRMTRKIELAEAEAVNDFQSALLGGGARSIEEQAGRIDLEAELQRINQATIPETERERLARDLRLMSVAGDVLQSQRMTKQAAGVVSKNVLKRSAVSLPDVEDLAALGVDPRLLDAVRRYQEPSQLVQKFSYSMDLGAVLPRYIEGMAKTYAWSVPTDVGVEPLGKRVASWLSGQLQRNDLRPPEKVALNTLRNTYLPMLMGRMTQRQLMSAASWEEVKYQGARLLNHPTIKDHLDDRIFRRLEDMFVGDRSMTYPQLGETISGYLHTVTLGGNLLSAGMNTLQTVLTTLPMLGWRATTTGLRKYFAGMPRYLKAISSGINEADALKAAWPEYAAAHLELTPVSQADMIGRLEYAAQTGGGIGRALGTARTTAQKLADWSMYPFSFTETANRVIGFYGARQRFMSEYPGKLHWYNAVKDIVEKVPESGPVRDQYANQFARQFVSKAHYGSGPMERPALTADWWAPWRQFTTFPLRTADLFINQWGAGGAGRGGAGALARAAMWSGLAYGAAKELPPFLTGGRQTGFDIQRGLIFGAMPMPETEGPLAGLPIVPPALQLLGGAGMALAGEPGAFQRSLPLLVPGGIAAARWAQVVPGMGGLARLFGRPYADYNSATQTGLVPVYSSTGKLQAYYRPIDLIVRALGGHQVSAAQEPELVKMLLSSRERILQMKRDMLQAMFENDFEHVKQIQEMYEEAFPRMGGLPVSPNDIRTLHLRRDISRIERLVETLPANVRPAYLAMVSSAFGAAAPEMLGMLQMPPPALRTIQQREPYRLTPGGTVNPSGESLHGVKFRDKLQAAGLQQSRQAGESFPDGVPGFSYPGTGPMTFGNYTAFRPGWESSG